MVIVAVSQCLEGVVHQGTYEGGSAMARAGVVGGRDLTEEAALAKLYCLFAAGHDAAEVRELVTRNLRGELTESTVD